MDAFIEAVGKGIGGGAVGAAVVIALLYMSKSAVAAAVGQAAKVELAELKGALDRNLELFKTERAKAEQLVAAYERYTDPLLSSASGLFFRLREIVETDRGRYLSPKAPPTTFAKYKRISTQYRIALVLGWTRALARELSYWKPNEQRPAKGIHDALMAFEQALADGEHIELLRLDGLKKLWKLEVPAAKAKGAGLIVESAMDSVLLEQGVREDAYHTFWQADPPRKMALCERVAEALTAYLGLPSVERTELERVLDEACEVITIREAWVFRDWQSSIGDMMLRPIDGGVRRFDLIGYRECEDLALSTNDPKARWVQRLEAVFLDLDMGQAEDDARVLQVRNVYVATAKLVVALTEHLGASAEVHAPVRAAAEAALAPTTIGSDAAQAVS